MRHCQVTVFTPTYNRRYTLQRLYDSLRKQTIKPMEWIIIDDGSSDQTFELIGPWIEGETSFEIIYLRVKSVFQNPFRIRFSYVFNAKGL